MINKLKLLASVLGFVMLCSSSTVRTSADITTVYICTGKYATKYHFSAKCRGLNNCKGDIKRISLSDARTMKRTKCGWE